MRGDAGAEKTAETGESKYCKSPILALHISRLFFPRPDGRSTDRGACDGFKAAWPVAETAVAFGSEFGQTPFVRKAP
jgi:hypothetical protein